MAGEGGERRKHPRVRRRFTASFRVRQEEATELSRKWDIVTIRDLSVAGISFNYHERMPMGTLLEFNIAIPSTAEPVNCLGDVCRVDEPGPDSLRVRRTPIYGIAASFQELTQETQEALEKLVERFHSAQ